MTGTIGPFKRPPTHPTAGPHSMGEALLLSEPLSAPKAANSVLVVKLGVYYRDRVHIRERVLVRSEDQGGLTCWSRFLGSV